MNQRRSRPLFTGEEEPQWSSLWNREREPRKWVSTTPLPGQVLGMGPALGALGAELAAEAGRAVFSSHQAHVCAKDSSPAHCGAPQYRASQNIGLFLPYNSFKVNHPAWRSPQLSEVLRGLRSSPHVAFPFARPLSPCTMEAGSPAWQEEGRG